MRGGGGGGGQILDSNIGFLDLGIESCDSIFAFF